MAWSIRPASRAFLPRRHHIRMLNAIANSEITQRPLGDAVLLDPQPQLLRPVGFRGFRWLVLAAAFAHDPAARRAQSARIGGGIATTFIPVISALMIMARLPLR